KPSCPVTRKSYPLGAAPYSAALISLSVPSIPTRRTRTSTPRPFGTVLMSGRSRLARCALLALPGKTATAFMVVTPCAVLGGSCCDSSGLLSVSLKFLPSSWRPQPSGRHWRLRQQAPPALPPC